MARSLYIFAAAFVVAWALSEYCKLERARKLAAMPRPGAVVPLAPDAGTIESRGGAAVVLNTDRNTTAVAEAPAIFTPPDNA